MNWLLCKLGLHASHDFYFRGDVWYANIPITYCLRCGHRLSGYYLEER